MSPNISPINVELMTASYALMYEIETKLRSLVDQTFTDLYGKYWFYRAYFFRKDVNSFKYDELVSCFGKYPQLSHYFDDSTRRKLYRLDDVRNHIIFMRSLTGKEVDYLKECHRIVMGLEYKTVQVKKDLRIKWLP